MVAVALIPSKIGAGHAPPPHLCCSRLVVAPAPQHVTRRHAARTTASVARGRAGEPEACGGLLRRRLLRGVLPSAPPPVDDVDARA